MKGVRKERKIVNEARRKGLIAFRSAGSHSPIDVCVIDGFIAEIKFIQCKPNNYSKNKTFALNEMFKFLNGSYKVSFEVI